MSMIGDWINTTPAAKRTTFNPIFPNGVLKKPGSEAGLSCGIANPFMFSLCVCVCVSSKPLCQNAALVFTRESQPLYPTNNSSGGTNRPVTDEREQKKKKVEKRAPIDASSGESPCTRHSALLPRSVWAVSLFFVSQSLTISPVNLFEMNL